MLTKQAPAWPGVIFNQPLRSELRADDVSKTQAAQKQKTMDQIATIALRASFNLGQMDAFVEAGAKGFVEGQLTEAEKKAVVLFFAQISADKRDAYAAQVAKFIQSFGFIKGLGSLAVDLTEYYQRKVLGYSVDQEAKSVPMTSADLKAIQVAKAQRGEGPPLSKKRSELRTLDVLTAQNFNTHLFNAGEITGKHYPKVIPEVLFLNTDELMRQAAEAIQREIDQEPNHDARVQLGQALQILRSELRDAPEFVSLAEAAFEKGLIIESSLQNIRSWGGDAHRSRHEELNQQFQAASEDVTAWKEIDDAWYTVKAPGTAGMRGKLGLGTNRINEFTVGGYQFAHALAVASDDYNKIVQSFDPEFDPKTEKKAVVLGGDSRDGSYDPLPGIEGIQFERPGRLIKLEALLNAAAGVRAYVFRMPTSTPQISWSAHQLKVDEGYQIVSGSMNTASHNPFDR